MKQAANYPSIDVEQTLALMPAWVKEKARRYRKQKKIAERAFGAVVKYIEQQQKKEQIVLAMITQEKQNIIVNYLRAYQPEMIGIFGSYARGEENSESDIDILIDLKVKISLFDLVQFHRELKELLGKKVDVVTLGGLKNEKLKNYIFRDIKYIVNEKR